MAGTSPAISRYAMTFDTIFDGLCATSARKGSSGTDLATLTKAGSRNDHASVNAMRFLQRKK